MRPIATLMGSLILAGNLLMAMPPRPNVTVVRSAEQAEREIRKEMASSLVEQGIEPLAAAAAVSKYFKTASKRTAVHVHVFNSLFPEVGHRALIHYGAKRALRSEVFDLRSYDHLIAMLQHRFGPVLPAGVYERAAHCAILNRTVG